MLRGTVKLVIVTSLSIFCYLIFAAYTEIQVKVNSEIPYGLSTNTHEISVFYNYVQNFRDTSLQEAIKNIVDESNVTLVFNSAYLGLGIYYKDQHNNMNDALVNPYDVSVIVKEESYLDPSLSGKNHIIDHMGNEMKIMDVYDFSNEFYDEYHYYIYNYFNEPYTNGYYLIDSEDFNTARSVTNNLVNEINNHEGFVCTLLSRSSQPIMIRLAGNSMYIIALIGLIFVFINIFMIYSESLRIDMRLFYISRLFGGTVFRVYGIFISRFLTRTFIGSLLGSVFYYTIFKNTLVSISFAYLPVLFFVYLIIIIFIYSLAYLILYVFPRRSDVIV